MEPDSGPSRFSAAGRGGRSRRPTLAGTLCLLLLLAASAPASAQPVSFTAPTSLPPPQVGLAPSSIAVGDFNGDSDPDLAVASVHTGGAVSNTVSILLGDAAGGFTAPTSIDVGADSVSIAVGDFNGDSDPDLAVAHSAPPSSSVSILLGAVGGSFTGPTKFGAGIAARSIAVGDFNGDSDPDLAVANAGFSSGSVSILLGAAGGSFTGPTNFDAGPGSRSVAVGDFNGDSDPDLAIVNESSLNVSILLGGAGGSFTGPTNFAAGDAPISVAVGDFNADSDPDLAVANHELSASSGGVSVLLGAAGGSFAAATNFAAGGLPRSVAVRDFNGDSHPDLAVAAGPVVSILLGAAGGGFTGPTNFSAGEPSPYGVGAISVAVGDFDRDSDPDLALGRAGSSDVSILLNTTGEPQLTDTAPNSPANDNSPKVKGSADAGSTVRVYASSDCSGAPAASGTAADFASPGLQVSVADDSSTTFRATATDAAGNPSPCSASSITYVEDSTAPDAPTLTATDPNSPANDNSPRVKGSAEAGSTVGLYASSDCSGSTAASGSAADFASPGLQVSVPDNSSSTFRATATDAAGNTSACSASSISYAEVTPQPPPEPQAPPCPAPDAPPGPTYRGTHARGGTVCLTVSADWSRVTSFAATDVRYDSCGGFGWYWTPFALAVNNRSFSGARFGTELSGSFPTDQGAQGTFRDVNDPSAPFCDSGVVSWSASTTAIPPWARRAPVSAADTTAPTLRLRARGSQRAIRQRGILIEVGCPAEACTASAKGTVSVPGAARTYGLKSATKQISRGGRAKLKLKFSNRALRAVKRALRKRKKVRGRVTVSVRDAAGNGTIEERVIRLRR